MTIEIELRGLHASSSLRQFVEGELQELQQHVVVSYAEVLIERQPGRAAVSLQVTLAVPGPDIRAAASDFTFVAAWLKLTRQLRQQIRLRQARQTARMNNRGRFRDAPGARSPATMCRV
ncbi:MAG: hypothetical protein FJ387_25210 [Verrucomicrobia bacterium]|nr:hypothetical protein [Verrucomicrobiota bacterium]